jgi:hypothetical protein
MQYSGIIANSPIFSAETNTNRLTRGLMASPSATVQDDVEEEPIHGIHHVRTASVILRSGDRVRRKVSLMSIYDENPFEDDQTPLLSTSVSGYSSVTQSQVAREVTPWEATRWDKLCDWLRSEGLKRYLNLKSR